MAKPRQEYFDRAQALFKGKCGFVPGSGSWEEVKKVLANFTAKDACWDQVNAERCSFMASLWLQAAAGQLPTQAQVDQWQTYKAAVYIYPGAWFGDRYDQDDPMPVLLRNSDQLPTYSAKIANYMRCVAESKGWAATFSKNVFQQAGSFFASAGPGMAALFGGIFSCVESGKCNFDTMAANLATALKQYRAALGEDRIKAEGEAAAQSALKAGELQSAIQRAKVTAAGTSSITDFLTSPLGWLSIGGVVLVVALVLSSVLSED
jgi:hypothetical protein